MYCFSYSHVSRENSDVLPYIVLYSKLGIAVRSAMAKVYSEEAGSEQPTCMASLWLILRHMYFSQDSDCNCNAPYSSKKWQRAHARCGGMHARLGSPCMLSPGSHVGRWSHHPMALERRTGCYRCAGCPVSAIVYVAWML